MVDMIAMFYFTFTMTRSYYIFLTPESSVESTAHTQHTDTTTRFSLIPRPAEHERHAAEQQSIREIPDPLLAELKQVPSISTEEVLPGSITEQQLSGPDRSGLINHLSEYARIQPQSHFLPAAFARSADGIGVGSEVAAFAAEQHAALEAVEEFDFHDEDAEVALEGLGGCGASEFVEVGEGEEAADGAGFDRVVVEDA